MDDTLNLNRDGYYVIRPEHEGVEQIEWHERDTPLNFTEIYAIIGEGCDLIERIQIAERGFKAERDPRMMLGVRFDPQGVMVDAWLDEEGMYRQKMNPLATRMFRKMSYIDVSHGLWGAVVIPCGKVIDHE